MWDHVNVSHIYLCLSYLALVERICINAFQEEKHTTRRLESFPVSAFETCQVKKIWICRFAGLDDIGVGVLMVTQQKDGM